MSVTVHGGHQPPFPADPKLQRTFAFIMWAGMVPWATALAGKPRCPPGLNRELEPAIRGQVKAALSGG